MRSLVLLAPLVLVLASCAGRFPQKPEPGTEAAAAAILDRSIRAHGNDPYQTAREIEVSFLGEWGRIAEKIQPALTDSNYRVYSTEVYDLRSDEITQLHRGRGGKKVVERTRDDVVVTRNGARDTSDASRETAALVADAYEMFITSPSYLRHREVTVHQIPDAEIDDRNCLRISATLEPGFGFSESDRIVYWIDEETMLLSRVSFSLEGYVATRGAHVTVDFTDHIERSGTLYPSKFEERVRAPLQILAHRWETTQLEVR